MGADARLIAAAAALGLACGPAWANERTAFVEANILGIFYHELGHALIDLLEMPVYGQEEDAADVLSILLIDLLYEEDAALDLAYHVSDGFWTEAIERAEDGDEIAFWGVHGPDEQRFYNTVCLFYGGNPDSRDDFAADMGLPEERAETCPDEYDLAYDSWGVVLDEITGSGDSFELVIDPDHADTLTAQLMIEEIAAMNDDFILPETLLVRIESCGEANAFYDPYYAEIIMCAEFEPYLAEIAEQW